ncbi:MAG TPA: hypothetical protein VJ608_12825 [Albitalea sp.]|nr:hypothetical protein [Albitalea sp.]
MQTATTAPGGMQGAYAWHLAGINFVEMDYRLAREACYRTPTGVLITPAWLLETATRANERYRELSFLYPAGTVHTERNLMRELTDHALEVAAWMEANGEKEAIFAGPFGPALPRKGERVQIRRGAVVYSTHPHQKMSTLQRALTVRVHSADRGYVDTAARASRTEKRVTPAHIHWVGAGGYWRWTDAENLVSAGP